MRINGVEYHSTRPLYETRQPQEMPFTASDKQVALWLDELETYGQEIRIHGAAGVWRIDWRAASYFRKRGFADFVCLGRSKSEVIKNAYWMLQSQKYVMRYERKSKMEEREQRKQREALSQNKEEREMFRQEWLREQG